MQSKCQLGWRCVLFLNQIFIPIKYFTTHCIYIHNIIKILIYLWPFWLSFSPVFPSLVLYYIFLPITLTSTTIRVQNFRKHDDKISLVPPNLINSCVIFYCGCLFSPYLHKFHDFDVFVGYHFTDVQSSPRKSRKKEKTAGDASWSDKTWWIQAKFFI